MKQILILTAALIAVATTATAQNRNPLQPAGGDPFASNERNQPPLAHDDPFAPPQRGLPPRADAGVDPFGSGAGHPAIRSKPKSVSPGIDLSVRYETFSLDLKAAAKLMRANLNDTELYAKLAEAEEGTQESLTVIRVKSGLRGTAESIAEHIYPTEYDPGSLPQSVGIQLPPKSTAKGENAVEGPGEPDPKTPSGAVEIDGLSQLAISASPTAYDTRNIGLTVEVEATMPFPDGLIELHIAPEHVDWVGTSVWGTGVSAQEMPEFESRRLTTSTNVRAGVPRMLGTVNRPPASKVEGDAGKHVWFAFVTVTPVK